MVTVPLGLLLPPGLRTIVYPKDLWDKVQRKEKIDEGKLKPLPLTYTLCHSRGCDGELEVTPDLLKNLKTGGGFMVFAVNPAGQPVGFPVPLAGFDQAYTGPPGDIQKYRESRRALMEQIEGQQKIRATIVVPK
jgi:invasion protein IalB